MTFRIKSKLPTTVNSLRPKEGKGHTENMNTKKKKELERSAELIITIWQRNIGRPGGEPGKPG